MMDFLERFFFGDPIYGGVPRSSKWPSVRKSHLALHPSCEVCGKKGTLLEPNEVHHLQSYSTRPDLELSKNNLATCCREHHLWFFHLGSFLSINERAKQDADIWFKKIKSRPKWNGDKWVYPVSK